MIHLTEKPVEMATRAMEYSTRPGEDVLDLFGGSGLPGRSRSELTVAAHRALKR